MGRVFTMSYPKTDKYQKQHEGEIWIIIISSLEWETLSAYLQDLDGSGQTYLASLVPYFGSQQQELFLIWSSTEKKRVK